MKNIREEVENKILKEFWTEDDYGIINFEIRKDQILVINKENKIVKVINKINSFTINEDNIEIYFEDETGCDLSIFVYKQDQK